MEDDVVKTRCAAIIQQLICSGDNCSIRQSGNSKNNGKDGAGKEERLLGTVVEELQQRAMLIYRLCRAKNEKLAANQTEDPAFCVLAAVASCQPALWAVLADWSRLLRPRSPELRFGPPVLVTVRLKEVSQFIARTSHLHAAFGVLDTSAAAGAFSAAPNGAKKRSREGDIASGNTLRQELAMELALTYFHLNVSSKKKFQAIVVAYEKEVSGEENTAGMRGAVDTRISTLCGLQNSRRSGQKCDGAAVGTSNKTDAGAVALNDAGDDDDNTGDYSVLFPSFLTFGAASPPSSSMSFEHLFSAVNLSALAESVSITCAELFFERLQLCLRNPLLYSPLFCNGGDIDDENNVKGRQIQYDKCGVVPTFFLGDFWRGSNADLLRSPAHFLHPARARADFLLPLPFQFVTSQWLWTRLLVAGLWLHAVDAVSGAGDDVPGGEATFSHGDVLGYCAGVVRSAQCVRCCSACGAPGRGKVILRLQALLRVEEEMEDDASLLSWEEMRKMACSTPVATRSFCNELLRCLVRRLEQTARRQVERDAINGGHDCTKITATIDLAKGGCNAPTSAFSRPTLRELVLEVCGSYPLRACRAALLAGAADELIVLNMLKCEDENNAEKGSIDCWATADNSVKGQSVNELLDSVLCVPYLREMDGVVECAACFQQFHHECIFPAQREPLGGIFLCHSCRLLRRHTFLESFCCSIVTNSF